jgi:hypothetical protein
MTLNWLGLVAGAAAFLAIWFGHVGVRKLEAIAPALWVPAGAALVFGLALETAALLTANRYVSAPLGIVGVTLLWDALEFWRQEKRVAHGHAPANPRNPRHARLLAAGRGATTVDWLKREPLGRPAGAEPVPAHGGRAS